MNENAFNPLSLQEILNGPTSIDWLVDGIIPPGTVGILAGDSGVGKTWLALDLALSVATGTKWLGRFDTKPGSVLVVDEENAALLLRIRLEKLIKGRAITDVQNIPLHFLVDKSINFSPLNRRESRSQPTITYIRLVNTLINLKPTLVIFDSLTRFHHSNENDSGEMSAIFAKVKYLNGKTGTACLFTHHTRKGRSGQVGERIRGSSDIRAFPDYTLCVEEVNRNILITHDKSRWSETLPPFSVGFDHTDDGALSIMYAGESTKDDLGDVWIFLREVLREGEKDRQELINLVVENSICQTRKLDKVLKWRVINSYLEKRKEGKKVIYKLGEKAHDEMEDNAAADEIFQSFHGKECENE